MTATVEPSTRRGIHRAWWVAAVTMAALVAAAGFRSSTGALLEPLEAEFGWSRATTSGAVSLNLVVYGLTAPFAAALMERFGIRRVVAVALLLVALGSGLTLVMTSPWQLWLLWGFAVGIGTGALALVFGAIIANRWFVRHRGVPVDPRHPGDEVMLTDLKGVGLGGHAAIIECPLYECQPRPRWWRCEPGP